MLTARAREFLSGFDAKPYPARLTEGYDILECFAHSERSETLLVRAKADGRLCVAKVGAEHAEMQPNILSLKHPGLPAFVESFVENGQPVLIRAYAAGLSARDELKNGPLPKKRVLDLGVKLADILSYLHAQQPPVIHRDIKPANIILDGENVYLIDFGIARSYTAGSTEDTVCFGTRDYAPPEQYGFAQTDARADIYALGATLYTLLTGRTDASRAAHTLRDAGLRRVVRRCTAFSPDDRYKSMRQLKRALTSLRHRRRRVLFAAVCALLVGATLIAVGPWLRTLRPGAPRFSDPLMRRAVLSALGKSGDAPLDKAELEEVAELWIFQDDTPEDEAAFEGLKEAWYATPRHNGSLQTLSDLAVLPNLSALWLGAEPPLDLGPLESVPRLTRLHLQFMEIEDLSVITRLPNLEELDLAGSRVADLGPIHECHALRRLALHGVACEDYSFLVGLDGFDYVGLYGGDSAAFLQYFRGKSTNHLNIGGAAFSRMDWLIEVRDLRVLELYDAELVDIEGIDGLLHLTRLDLSGNPALTDLSPLLNIRTLEELTLSRDMQKAAEAISPQAAFDIRYRD